MITEINAKDFSEKLHLCLDEMDAPKLLAERCNILSKLLDISRLEANSLLSGRQIPSEDIVEKIAAELDVDVKWLQSSRS